MLAISTWFMLLGHQIVLVTVMLPAAAISLSPSSTQLLALLVSVAFVLGLWFTYWKKLEYLDDGDTVNSNKVTVGIFFLTVALVAFPGTALGPLIYAWMSKDRGMALLSYYSMFGFPVFVILSLIGFSLIRSGKPRGK